MWIFVPLTIAHSDEWLNFRVHSVIDLILHAESPSGVSSGQRRLLEVHIRKTPPLFIFNLALNLEAIASCRLCHPYGFNSFAGVFRTVAAVTSKDESRAPTLEELQLFGISLGRRCRGFMQSTVLTYHRNYMRALQGCARLLHTATPIFKGTLSAQSERDWDFAGARGYALQFPHFASCLVVVDRKT